MAIGRAAATDIPDVSARRRWPAEIGDFCRRRPLGAIGSAIVLVNILVGAGAEVIAPYDPLATDYGAMLAAPDAAHWLGTDAFGRDVLSRIVYGSRTAMLVGFACAFFGATIGAVIGVTSAYFGGRVDLLIQRVMDIFLAFPLIILALAVVAILGTGVTNVIMAITIPMIPRAALVSRSSALAIRELPYVDAARAKGLWLKLILTRHALKNAILPVLTIISLEFAFLLGGLVVTEQVFNLNGLGMLFVESVARRDYTLTQALVMLVAFVFIFVNFTVDLMYAWLDPRIRFR